VQSSIVIERKLDRLVKTVTGCWQWPGALDESGYGQVVVGGRNRAIHSVAWEYLMGPIPSGLELDHKCRNRACANPAHLEPVTHVENMARVKSLAPDVRAMIEGAGLALRRIRKTVMRPVRVTVMRPVRALVWEIARD
jgi:hypothetical protein